MATPVQNQAAITAAIQAAAVADLVLLNAFVSANGAAFNTLLANINTLANNCSSLDRAAKTLQLRTSLMQVLNDFNTLVSNTTTSQTSIPVA